MKVLVGHGGAWSWRGSDIYYGRNTMLQQNDIYRKNCSLCFTINLVKGETYQICQSFPYTYSDLLGFLRVNNLLSSVPAFSIYGNCIPVIEIAKPDLVEKKTVLVTARVHPGECQSSYIAEGLIQFLLTKSEVQGELLEQFNFLIIPMVNVDGVLVGNYRCNAAGLDLNRQWPAELETPEEQLESTGYRRSAGQRAVSTQRYKERRELESRKPEVDLIMSFARSKKLAVFVDLHGHFGIAGLMGNCSEADGYFAYLAKQLPQFNMSRSNILSESDKRSTARKYINKVIGGKSYGLECSFDIQNQDELRSYGRKIGHSLKYFTNTVQKDEYVQQQKEIMVGDSNLSSDDIE